MLPEGFTFRPATEGDMPEIAAINAHVFNGHKDNKQAAVEWIDAHFRFLPIYQYFVVVNEKELAGYIGWKIDGGFLRANPVVELEQLGVAPKYAGLKLGTHLMQAGMEQMHFFVQKKNNRIESHIRFVVWVYENNENARAVYNKLFPNEIGKRKQYGDRVELQFACDRPLILPVRGE